MADTVPIHGSKYKITKEKVWRLNSHDEWVLSEKTVEEVRAAFRRQERGFET